ncbi:type II secretion system F family protein, partial [Candidatus Woesearchaeota archaeon]|nr:type II secretion system F family protein [Candidatus Woesearchaeota archaeon]
MRIFERIYINSAKPLPKNYREGFKKLMMYAGIRDESDIYLGKAVLLGLLAAAIVIQSPKAVFGLYKPVYIIAAVLAFLFVQIIAYLRIFFKAEERSKKVENALPDAFQLIAANLRSGMTPFKALKQAAHENLGPLQEEITYATSRALGTEYFSETLLRISDRIKSDLLERSLHLFTTAMRSGGNLAQVLEELATDISETQALKRELRTSTKTYTAFIMFTIIFGTPLLLAISVNFVKMISAM